MANDTETYSKNKINNNANEPAHYSLLTVGVFVGVFGVLLRFLTTWALVDIVSNIILIIGIVISLIAVSRILK